MKRFDCLVAVLIVAVWSTSAFAATVSFVLDNATGPPGTFTLYASASPGDNGGIASYGIPLTGPITSLNHRSPIVISSANFAPVGFSNLRSADDVTNVFAGQPLSGPAANYLYGIGQTANSFANLGIPLAGSPDATSDSAWTAPIVIATGTYDVSSVGRPRFAPPTADLFSNVFATVGNSADKLSAQISTQVIDFIDPGPPSVVLNNLGEREIGNGIITATAIAEFSDPPFTWSNLQPVTGPNLGTPAIAATLDAGGNFSWNPAGSNTGSKGSGNVVYQWKATVANGWGADTDVAFSVILIPEPATLFILGFDDVSASPPSSAAGKFSNSAA